MWWRGGVRPAFVIILFGVKRRSLDLKSVEGVLLGIAVLLVLLAAGPTILLATKKRAIKCSAFVKDYCLIRFNSLISII